MLALLLILLGCGRRPTSEQQVVDLYIESDGDFLAFRPDTLTCPTGALVRLTFHHAGQFLSARHDWVLTYPGQLEALSKDSLDNDGILSKDDPRVIAATPMCDKGETVMIQFIAPRRPATIRFCVPPIRRTCAGSCMLRSKRSTHKKEKKYET